MKRCAVILVNYQDYADKYLGECYASLKVQSYPQDAWQIFIVDNASTPESREKIKSLAPAARIVPVKENFGWSGGNNRGIEKARAEGFDYFILLNIDTSVDQDWLKELADEAVRRNDTHIFQSKILIHGTEEINSVGNRIHFLGYGSCNGYRRIASSASKFSMDFASGASMLVKREVFERIGLFREDYFMYVDDLEFSWRARIAGFNLGFCEKSLCRHKYDFRKILKFIYFIERNRWLTLLTLEKLGTLALIFPVLILSQSVLLIYLLMTGKTQAVLDLISFFLKKSTWSGIKEERREIGRLRIRPDREIVKNFASNVFIFEGSPFVRTLLFLINPLLWLYWTLVKLLIIW